MPTTADLFTALRTRFEPMMSQAIVGADLLAFRPPAEASDLLAHLAQAMTRLADREQSAPPIAGLHESHLAACRLAACTFADERLLSRQAGWLAHSLQLHRLGCSDGGTRFYTLLSSLLAQAGQPEPAPADPLLLQQEALRPQSANTLPSADSRRMVLLARRMAACADALAHDDSPAAGPASDRCAEASLAVSAQAAAAFMALCLVYGFRGELYAAGSAPLLEELLASCAQLLQATARTQEDMDEMCLSRPQLPERIPKRAFSLPRPGPAFLALVPVLLTILWYLLCAGLINSLELPWGNV